MLTVDSRRGCLIRSAYSRRVSRWGLSCVFLLMIPGMLAAEDWPQFRGPNCSGISTSKMPLPTEFSATENVAWSAEVGDGIGSATVAAGRVLITGMVGSKPEELKFVVSCFEAATGKPLWKREFDPGPEPLPPITDPNSYASSTPAADAERVYVYFTRLGLAALDARDGTTVWEIKLPEPFFIFDWGAGMSPVLFEDKVIFCQDDDLSPALYAVDRKTGDVIWKDDRMLLIKSGGISSCFAAGTADPVWERRRIGNEGSYLASPVSGDGKIYVAGQNGVVVVLKDGPELNVLATNDLGGSIIGTPAIADGRLYIRTRTKLYGVGK